MRRGWPVPLISNITPLAADVMKALTLRVNDDGLHSGSPLPPPLRVKSPVGPCVIGPTVKLLRHGSQLVPVQPPPPSAFLLFSGSDLALHVISALPGEKSTYG